jgi:hypothetical protein
VTAAFLDNDRVADLLVTRAIEGLDDGEEQELERLAEELGNFDPEAVDRVAAALALNQLEPAEMPMALRQRVERDARIWLDGKQSAGVLPFPRTVSTPASPPPAQEIPATSSSPAWWAAAAGVAVAAFGLWQAETVGDEAARLTAELAAARAEAAAAAAFVSEQEARIAALAAGPQSLSPGDLRTRLLEEPGTGLWGWSATEDPAAAAASGDVVWNGDEQRGFMRFVGLAPNEQGSTTYQLWIFDEARDERFPVDGGVFDIPPGSTEVIVPIRPTLGVTRPALFAITVEPPGGVMVSSRERIALVAEPGA